MPELSGNMMDLINSVEEGDNDSGDSDYSDASSGDTDDETTQESTISSFSSQGTQALKEQAEESAEMSTKAIEDPVEYHGLDPSKCSAGLRDLLKKGTTPGAVNGFTLPTPNCKAEAGHTVLGGEPARLYLVIQRTSGIYDKRLAKPTVFNADDLVEEARPKRTVKRSQPTIDGHMTKKKKTDDDQVVPDAAGAAAEQSPPTAGENSEQPPEPAPTTAPPAQPVPPQVLVPEPAPTTAQSGSAPVIVPEPAQAATDPVEDGAQSTSIVPAGEVKITFVMPSACVRNNTVEQPVYTYTADMRITMPTIVEDIRAVASGGTVISVSTPTRFVRSIMTIDGALEFLGREHSL